MQPTKIIDVLTSPRNPMVRPRFAIAVVAVLLFLLTSVAIDHGPWARGVHITDVGGYEEDGEAIVDGDLPYRDVEIEYPPGSLLAFVPPALIADEAEPLEYEKAFSWLMRGTGVVLTLATALALATLGADARRMAAALGLIALSPLLLGPLVLERYDLLPAAMTALAMAAIIGGRSRRALALVGAGAATKLYPVVLAPLLVGIVWQRRGRREAVSSAAIGAAVVLVAVVPFAIIGFDGLVDALRVQSTRPLNRETTGGGLLLVAHQLTGMELRWEVSHGSANFVGDLPDALALISVILQVAALGWIWWTTIRARMTTDRLVLAATASVLAFVVFGKVLSPQFLIWLLPLVVLVSRWQVPVVLLSLAMALTQAYFPSRYFAIARYESTPSWLIAGRNAVLLVLLGVLVRRLHVDRDMEPGRS